MRLFGDPGSLAHASEVCCSGNRAIGEGAQEDELQRSSWEVVFPCKAHSVPVERALHLERPTSFQLTQFTVYNITRLDGEMVSREAGEVILSATWMDSVTDVGFDGEGWTLRIPESNVTALDLKRVSW